MISPAKAWDKVLDILGAVGRPADHVDEKFDPCCDEIFSRLVEAYDAGEMLPFTMRRSYAGSYRIQITLRGAETERREYWIGKSQGASRQNSQWLEPQSYPEQLHDVYVYVTYAVKVLDQPGQTPEEAYDHALQEIDFVALPDDINLVYPCSHLGYTDDITGAMIDFHNDHGHEKTVQIDEDC